MNWKWGLFLLLISSGLIFAGCDEDSAPDTPAENETICPPIVDDLVLLSNYKITLETMNGVGFACLFHEGFRMTVHQAVFDEWAGSTHSLSELFFNRDQMLDMHQNIFDGLEGVLPDGLPALTLDHINVLVLDKEGVWEAVSDDMVYFSDFSNAYKARMNVLMQFGNSGNEQYEVNYTFDFIVVLNTEGGDGGVQFLGIVPAENTSQKSAVNVYYDAVLSFYRTLDQ